MGTDGEGGGAARSASAEYVLVSLRKCNGASPVFGALHYHTSPPLSLSVIIFVRFITARAEGGW
jgi:hypothetical protein